MLVLALEVLGSFVELVSPRLIGLALQAPVRRCEPMCLSFGWFSVDGVNASVRPCESVSSPFSWSKVYGVGAVGSPSTWFSVRVVSGGVLVPPLYSRLFLVCSCLVVTVVTDSHLCPSLLHHSCLSSIVEIGLSAIIVNLLTL